MNTLIHIDTHTYHPEITKLVPQTNYALQSNDNTVLSPQFSLHQLYMTDSTPSLIIPLFIMYNLLLTLQNLEFFLTTIHSRKP